MANQSDVSGRTEQRQEITNQRRHRTGCKQFNEVRTEAISSWRKMHVVARVVRCKQRAMTHFATMLSLAVPRANVFSANKEFEVVTDLVDRGELGLCRLSGG